MFLDMYYKTAKTNTHASNTRSQSKISFAHIHTSWLYKLLVVFTNLTLCSWELAGLQQHNVIVIQSFVFSQTATLSNTWKMFKLWCMCQNNIVNVTPRPGG